MKFISFPKIGQFRDVVKQIKYNSVYTGQNENNEPTFNPTLIAPTLKAFGTVKLHGTNSTITYGKDGVQAQKRTSIISPAQDNAGFAAFVESKKETIISICNELMEHNELHIKTCSIMLPGEWAGIGIQKGVGISNIPKSWFLFADFKVIPDNPEYASFWLPTDIHKTGVCSIPDNIYNILNYKTFTMDIDFENPGTSQNTMIAYVDSVEKECPVAKALGFPETIGEGIVWTVEYKGRHQWKTKGDKHANSKVKILRPVDNELINKKIDIANKVCPAWRLEQIYNEVFDTLNGGTGDMKRFGEYIKAVNADIIKEELDRIIDANLTPKDIFKFTPKLIKIWFNDKLNDEIGM